MTKKQKLKNLIKECVREVLFEEGTLKQVVSEVSEGLIKKQPVQPKKIEEKLKKPNSKNKSNKLNETKKRLLESISKDAYGGVDIFEGTRPLTEARGHGPMKNIDPEDRGVDIDKIPGSNIWKHLIK